MINFMNCVMKDCRWNHPILCFNFLTLIVSQLVLLIYLRNNIYRTILYKHLTSLHFLSSIILKMFEGSIRIKFYRARFTKVIES